MKVKKLNESEWRQYVDHCDTATFFHTPDWYKVWKEHAGYNYEARLLSFESGKELLLPLGYRKRLKGLVKEYFSSPVGTYGGPLSNSQLSDNEVMEVEGYLGHFKSVQVRANPLNPILKNSFTKEKDFTQIIDLKKGWKPIFKNWTKGHSSAAKKGIRQGIEVRIADISDWKKYYHLYQDSRKRWGERASNNYDWKLFKIISQLKPTVCKLWLASSDEKIVSGCLCFYHNQHIVYWHGASSASYFHLKPVHVLQYHIIKDAIESGYSWYDFNPSGGHEGVINFKKGFGTKKFSADVFEKQSFIIKRIQNLKEKFI